MTEKDDVREEDLTAENLKGAGQRILGNLEIIGGIITGDPVTAAEGEFNDSVGKAHQDTAKVLTAIEDEEEKED
jgi:uncharacterized protein YjbJ (UPF0337 family)